MGLSTDLSTLSTDFVYFVSHNIHMPYIYYSRKREFLFRTGFGYPQVWIVLWITKDCLLLQNGRKLGGSARKKEEICFVQQEGLR